MSAQDELFQAIKKGIERATADGAKGSNILAGGMTGGMRYLLDRIEKLEADPFVYDGPWETGKAYRKGMFVSHGGSVWHANYTTGSRPGDGPAWTLAVKHGRDAR